MCMIKVNIPTNVTTDAIRWASRNIGTQFNVQHNFPGDFYTFSFDNHDDASFFALRWTQ